MTKLPKKVFVRENDTYTEITYDELRRRVGHDSSYRGRKFIPLHGMLMEVTPEEYRLFYQEQEQQRYAERRSIMKGDLTLDAPLPDAVIPYLIDPDADVSRLVEDKILTEALRKGFSMLSRKEQILLYQYYCEKLSEQQLSELYGVVHQTISRRIERIRRKLKGFIE